MLSAGALRPRFSTQVSPLKQLTRMRRSSSPGFSIVKRRSQGVMTTSRGLGFHVDFHGAAIECQ